jgi:hypothetical protein
MKIRLAEHVARVEGEQKYVEGFGEENWKKGTTWKT